MNIAVLIGNGFDIAQGANTRYSDFYKVYKKEAPINEIDKRMKDEIDGEKVETWADMEKRLGEFTENFTDQAAFEEFYFHLTERLNEYLKEEQKKIKAENTEKYLQDLWNPEKYFTPAEANEIQSVIAQYQRESFNMDIISYNYTDILERTLGYTGDAINLKIRFAASSYFRINNILKIHGRLDGTPILGVNDVTQISNKAYASNLDMTDIIVKPQANNVIGSLIDRQCKSIIQDANFIVLHGVSLGDTDNLWWQIIGERMRQPNTTLLYFRHTGKVIENNKMTIIGREKRIAKSFIFERCKIEKEKQGNVGKNIYVSLNSNFLASAKKGEL